MRYPITISKVHRADDLSSLKKLMRDFRDNNFLAISFGK